MTVIYGHDKELIAWASMQLAGNPDFMADDRSRAIGFMKDGRVIGAVVYNNYQRKSDGSPLSIELSIATIDKAWASRHNLRAIFAYPFIDLRVERAQILTSVTNEGVNSVVSRLGFIKEGRHVKAYPDGGDAYSWGMTKEDCKWLA